jgi:PAS domain S-box-containing protein
LFPKESREESLALSQQTSAGHRWEVVEIPIQTKDGSVRTVLWNSATLNSPQGEIIATIAQGQDITERKRAESTLLESERRFKGLFDTMGSGVAIYAVRNDGENGADYIIQDFNHRALEIEGKSKTEVVGRSLADLRPNIDSYGLIPIFHQVWKTGQPAFYPAKIYVDEHYVNWYENTIFRLPSGEIVAIYDDVTERKRAEEELKLKDSAVTSSINAIAIADLAGSLTYVNPAFLKIWGYEDRQEALGRSALSFWKNPEEARRTMQEIRAQGKWSGEMEGQRKDGASIQVQLLANLIRDDSDTPVAMMASFIDITERKRAEMEIRQTKEQLEESNHLARIGTWDWIMETDSVLWSDELSRIAGRDPSLPAPSFADQPQFYTPTSWKILSEAVTLALTDHEPYQLELEMVRVDGSIREIIAIGTVKLDLTGKVIGLHGTVQDITERKRAEKALHEANRKLNLLSSTTRHDINNQITTLLGNLILLKKRQPQLSSDDNLQKVEKAAEQLAATIRFTKNYEDIGVKAPSWASIDRQIREAFTLLHPAGVELKTDTEGVEVLADPLFERIPHNLIDNSMRHGEHVTRIKMSMEQKGDAVLVVYEDDGVGISDDDKKHIFEKGFGKNTGFGLFLCQEILAITGITITETGKAGEGARFEMLVPAGGWRFAR